MGKSKTLQHRTAKVPQKCRPSVGDEQCGEKKDSKGERKMKEREEVELRGSA